jgi:hypothetical protein
MMTTRFRLGFLYLLLSMALTTATLAEVSWEQVKERIRDSRSYEVLFVYEGEQGRYTMNYRFAGSKVRTEVLSSETHPHHAGTVILFDRDWNPDKVRIKTGGGLLMRNLSHNDVVERPHFHRGLFQIALERLGGLTPRTRQVGKDTLFLFGSKLKVRVNEKAELVEIDDRGKGRGSLKKFSGHKWNGPPDLEF